MHRDWFDPKTAQIFGLAAVWHEADPPIVSRKGHLDEALDQLEAALKNADHLIGHNIRHDLPHLEAARPLLAALVAAPIDTLWLNPSMNEPRTSFADPHFLRKTDYFRLFRKEADS